MWLLLHLTNAAKIANGQALFAGWSGIAVQECIDPSDLLIPEDDTGNPDFQDRGFDTKSNYFIFTRMSFN